jgi:hypothetical protein
MRKTFQHNDLVLPMLELPNPCPVELTIDDDYVCLREGPRDWQWSAADSEFLSCGTMMSEHTHAPKRIKRFKSTPVTIEAIRWTGANSADVDHFTFPTYLNTMGPSQLAIVTLEGTMMANVGDWIVRGLEGELYPCKDSIFQKKYEPVEE